MRDHLATLIEDFRRYDGEIAVVRFEGVRRRVATYGDIARLAGRFAAWMERNGIGPGDRVVLWAENSAEWVAAFHGCILRAALVVPLDAYGTPEFAGRIVADVQAKLIVGDALLVRQLPADIVTPRLLFENWSNELPHEVAGPVSEISSETPLQILFTSGTTGEPKGIVHTHGNVLASIGPIERAAQGYMRYEKYVHPLRFLHTLPLSHVFGQTMGLWIPPIFRAEVHFESRLVAPRLIETIKRERISVLAAVPRVFALIKAHLEAEDPKLPERIATGQSLRAWKRWWVFRDVHRAFGLKFWALISGGGALPPALEQFWNALGFVVVQGYGMTETTALITLNHPFHVARGTIGKPLPGREVRIGPDGEVLVRGPMISTATWSGGELRSRDDEWLATGDLAEKQDTGELRFVGRKSEVIVTGTGVNIHPEDLEAAIENQAAVTACAVVPVDTPSGPEPYAVLAVRGSDEQAAAAIANANASLAAYQRIYRWSIWPEPDLPRTSTGKVRRKPVAEWVKAQTSTGNLAAQRAGTSDWLLFTIMQITGEAPPSDREDLRLAEDLHLDSLGRVQLAAAIEQKLGMPPESGLLESAQTLSDVRALLRGQPDIHKTSQPAIAPAQPREAGSAAAGEPQLPRLQTNQSSPVSPERSPSSSLLELPTRFLYPVWPWWAPVRWVRVGFIEGIMRPLVRLLAGPRVVSPAAGQIAAAAPMVIVANHVTTYDGPLVQYALPGAIRRRMAAAMSGEMLEDFRHFRNPDRAPGSSGLSPFGPAAYLLLTALFNVFPLPRSRDFQRSFAHAGAALDRGFNVLVFPEGTRSATGQLARFRPGIGLLVRQSHAPVLPVAICGLGELKARGSRWFRSGKIEVHVGEPIFFDPDVSESAITERLRIAVQKLLTD